MHLIESYSKILGAKIDKPEIYTKFYSLPFDKYITVQSSSPMPAKSYPYLQDVVDAFSRKLREHGIQIVQIGGKEDHVLRGVYNLCGQTSINQSAYVLSNSLLHFGIDSAMIHLASAFNVPTVGVYSVSPPQNCGAFFGNKNIFIEPQFVNRGYAYNPGENPSPTKTIKPEEVIIAIAKELNIEISIPKSLYIGERYQDWVIEYVPNYPLHPSFEVGKLINVRLDFAFDTGKFNDQVMMQTLQQRDVVIVTDRPINVEMIAPFKSKIKTLMYRLDKNDNIDFVKKMKSAGIKFNLVCEDPQKLDALKFKYMDYEIVHLVKHADPQDIEKVRAMNFNGLKYKSNRYILADGKIYISKAALYENKPINSVEILEQDLNIIENKESILQELEHFYIYA